jgi:hypothetical protein
MIPDCTLTTACFNLSNYNENARDIKEGVEYMRTLLETPCYLVIYTDNSSINEIKKIRNDAGLENLTHYIVIELTEFPKYYLLSTIRENREKYYPTRDIRTFPESHLVVISKFDFVLNTIETNPFKTSKFGWIDSHLNKNFSKICENYENNILLKILHETKPNKFHIQILNICDKKFKEKEKKREMYEEYRYIVCGGLFITGLDIGKQILNRLNEVAIHTTYDGYGHGEEMFYLEILDEFYDDIERSYGDYKNIIDNFIYTTKGHNYIIELIIKNSIMYGYLREGYDCCKKLLNEIETFKIKIDYEIYFSLLFNYYIILYYYKKEEAHDYVLYILDLINKNPYIKKEFNKNPDFYNSQFAYVVDSLHKS